MTKLDRYDFSEIVEALTEPQLDLLEAAAKETGLPATGWTASHALVMMARIWATVRLGRELEGEVIDPNESQRRYTAVTALDAAEASLFKEGCAPGSLPKSVRATLARWKRDVRDP